MQVNRLLYRAKQRGFLEMDLLVGMWAENNVPKMDAAQLKAMEEVLDQENPDLFKWLTGQESASEAMQANAAFKVLRCTSLCRMQEASCASQGLCRTGFVPEMHTRCTQTHPAGRRPKVHQTWGELCAQPSPRRSQDRIPCRT